MTDTSLDYLPFQVDLSRDDVVSACDELPLWSALAGRLLLDHIPLGRGLRVLDVGCGTGFPLLELAQRLGSTCVACGVDPWTAGLRRSQFKARVWGVRNAAVYVARAEALPFAGGQFDLVVSNLGVNNFDRPEAVLRECWRVMKPAARLALTTNLQGHAAEFYAVFEAALVGLELAEALTALQRHIAHRATVPGLVMLLQRTGFEVVQVHQATFPLRFSDGSALFRHYFIKLGFLDGWRSVLPEAERPAVFAALEANLNRLAETQGELILTVPIAYVAAQRS